MNGARVAKYPFFATVTTMTILYSSALFVKPPIDCSDKEPITIPTKEPSSTPFSSISSSSGAGGPDYTGATFGTAMGFCSGYLVKKAGKIAALTVGAGFVVLQVLEHNGYISISWNKVEGEYIRQLDLDRDGVVGVGDAKVAVNKIVKYLGGKWQMNGGFAGGFLLGLRFG